MPTQRNYGKNKSSILRDIHQGKDIDLLSKEYYIPQVLIKEWVEKEKQDNDLDIFISELSSKSPDRISCLKKKCFSVLRFKRILLYIGFFSVIAIVVILAFLSMDKICYVANEKEEFSLNIDIILESHKRIGMSVIDSQEQK